MKTYCPTELFDILVDSEGNTGALGQVLAANAEGLVVWTDAVIDLQDNSIRRDGSIAFQQNQSLGNNRLIDVGDPINAGDAVNFSFADGRYLQILPNQVLRFPPPTPATSGARYTPIVNAAGDGYEFFREYMDFARRVTPLAHQLDTSFQEYLTLNAVVPEDGDYELTVSYRWSMDTSTSNFLAHVLFNGDFIFPLHIEPADSAGIGENVPNSQGGTTNTGTDQFQRVSHEDIFSLSAGPQTFRLEFRGQVAFSEPTIYEALIKLKRVRRG